MKLTEEHRRKIAEGNKRRKGMKYKPRVPIPSKKIAELYREGISGNNLAKMFKCSWMTIKRRLRDEGITMERTPAKPKENIVLPKWKEKAGRVPEDKFLMDVF